jgi:hypothetical protein
MAIAATIGIGFSFFLRQPVSCNAQTATLQRKPLYFAIPYLWETVSNEAKRLIIKKAVVLVLCGQELAEGNVLHVV